MLRAGQLEKPRKDWVDAKTIELANQKRFFMSSYFVENPDHIIGKLDSYSMYLCTKKRERTGLKCVGSMRDVVERLPLLIGKLTVEKKIESHSQENVLGAENKPETETEKTTSGMIEEIKNLLFRLEEKLTFSD